MVSMLSSRLMKNLLLPKSATTNNNEAGRNTKPSSNSGCPGQKRTSGYSADREGTTGTPPLRDASDDKQKRANQIESLSKKRKLAEINYDVANARADIAKAGLSCPPGIIGRSRALPPGSVDMSSVTLLLSSKYDEEKFMTENHRTVTDAFISAPDIGLIYSELLKASRPFYNNSRRRVKIPVVKEDPQHTGDSIDTPSSCSLSDTESDDANENNIPPRADEHPTTANERRGKLKDDIFLQIQSPRQNSITFEQALSYSPLAR
jgi:hypothetical protein